MEISRLDVSSFRVALVLRHSPFLMAAVVPPHLNRPPLLNPLPLHRRQAAETHRLRRPQVLAQARTPWPSLALRLLADPRPSTST